MKTKDIIQKYNELEYRWSLNKNNDLDYHLKLYKEWEEFREKEWTENEKE